MNPITVLPPGSRRRSHEIWVGLFAIIGVLSALVLLFTLTEPAILRGRYTAFTSVSDASGLRRGDPVRMLGVNIGRVTGFKINQNEVQIQLEIEKQYQIPQDSRTELSSTNLLGEIVVEIIPGSSTQPLAAKQSLPGTGGASAFSQINDLAGEAVNTLDRLQQLLDERTIENIQASSSGLNQALQELTGLIAEQRQQLGELTGSLRNSAMHLQRATAGGGLERSIKQLDSLTSRMDSVAQSLGRSTQYAEAVLARIDRGEGSLGLFTKDKSLYLKANQAASSINQAAAEITQLAADIRRDPKKYLKVSVF